MIHWRSLVSWSGHHSVVGRGRSARRGSGKTYDATILDMRPSVLCILAIAALGLYGERAVMK
ncbi:hypothetical protein L873DRAFT_1805906 [Choiromyces venosus 120613-1]|uniref:Uncharacterized protein n=1 Tax=Choiromyces venosus 120613-1 TaxID=1336337 RepID=A0A3N4JNH6_9PEZI|nr:hypothetical protein L873DRAFT_1805906 [Choiromyces venosus 120613-1]